MGWEKKLLYVVLPLVECNSANRDVTKQQKITWGKIQQRESLSDVQKFTSMEEDNAKYLIDGIRDNIDSLQDKAKVTAVAVTLAFSMVGGISGYLLNLKEKFYANEILTGALIFFVISSCFYLINAGYFSLITLNSRPKYDFNPDDFEYLGQIQSDDKKKEEKLTMLGEQHKMTTFQNTILNNYVDCSNNNLRNALISLGIFFSLICLSFLLAEKIQEDTQSKAVTEQSQMMKDIKAEIQTLKQELESIKSSNEYEYQKLNSSIAEQNVLLDEILKDDTEQENNKR
ncbi:hypothetical protein NGI46_07310 [Peribacillus butanolivorans]|uniref:hypothetical protein n=1 Tax=Peribacillus butanolivorans TaxID=421767 RepID=UPI00207C66E8|nr:hypothetical protein [Peribacillus butanolivorans]MCO0597276.1 hypothetical protein [Peribacillus butanolivorans]